MKADIFTIDNAQIKSLWVCHNTDPIAGVELRVFANGLSDDTLRFMEAWLATHTDAPPVSFRDGVINLGRCNLPVAVIAIEGLLRAGAIDHEIYADAMQSAQTQVDGKERFYPDNWWDGAELDRFMRAAAMARQMERYEWN